MHLHRQQIHGRRTNELGHKQIGRVLVKLHGGAELLQAAAIEHGNAMAHGHRFHLVVGHIKGGYPQGALQLHDLAPGVPPQFGVEVAKWFIH